MQLLSFYLYTVSKVFINQCKCKTKYVVDEKIFVCLELVNMSNVIKCTEMFHVIISHAKLSSSISVYKQRLEVSSALADADLLTL